MKRKVTIPPRDDESPAAVLQAVRDALARHDQLLEMHVTNSRHFRRTASNQWNAAKRHLFDAVDWYEWLRDHGHAAEAGVCRKLLTEHHLVIKD